MNVHFSSVVACMVSVGGIAFAQASGPGGSPPQAPEQRQNARPGARLPDGVGTAILMLALPAVHADLKLTDDQTAKLRELIGQRDRPNPNAPRNANSGAERKAQPDAEEAARILNAVRQILTQEQQRRLGQIVIQAEGPSAFLMPQVAGALNLSEGQRSEIQQVVNGLRRNALQANLSPQERRAKLQAERKEALDKILALLTEAQQSVWKQLQGEPFRPPKA